VLSHSHNQLTDGLFDIESENTETESELFGRGAFQLRSKKLRERPIVTGLEAEDQEQIRC
jgi:hypothetical protein